MRCARCVRDTESVRLRPEFCPAYLCDTCNEYEETWLAYKMESGSKDRTEFNRLYDKLGELRERIDQFHKEATLEDQKKGGPRMTKNDWREWNDGF